MDRQDILKLLSQEEGLKVEFKQEFYKIDHQDKDVGSREWNELIKDIISIANGNSGVAHEYGYLIIGVDDTLKLNKTRDLYDVSYIELKEKTILQKLNSYCNPPLQDIYCDFIPVDEKRLFVISIPPSCDVHEISKDLTVSSKKTFPAGTVFVRRKGEICTASGAERDAIKREKSNISSTFLIKAHKQIHHREKDLDELTKNFIARDYIFDVIEEFINKESKGYFLIEGEPGIGKTTLLAEYIRRKKGLAYFIDIQGNRPEHFLKNICLQLIAQYNLKVSELPEDATRDGAFLRELLVEASSITQELQEKVIIGVDALEQAAKDSIRENILYLPRLLHTGIYFIITQTPNTCHLLLSNTPRKLLNLGDYSEQNFKKIEEYIDRSVQKSSKINEWLNKQGIQLQDFIKILAPKSDNNFRYISSVLEDLEENRYSSIKDIEKLPTTLKAYYENYWQQMGMEKDPPIDKIKIVRLLVDVKQPITCSLIAKWTQQSSSRIENIIGEWKCFLREELKNEYSYYSFFSTHFHKFLRNKNIIIDSKSIISDLEWTPSESLLIEEKKYILKYLVDHFVDAYKVTEISSLLANFNFIENKIKEESLEKLLEDYDLVFNSNLHLSEEQSESLHLVQGAIRLSARALSQNKNQLAGQLLGRLLFCHMPLIQAMLEQVTEWQSVCWLRPLTASLTAPSWFLLYTLWDNDKQVKVIALYCQAQRVISAADDGAVKIWDLNHGIILHTLEGHKDAVNAVAITPDEQKFVSASDDCTLKIWDLSNGTILYTLEGHEEAVNTVVITPDGQKIISASDDCTLKVWDLSNGKILRTLEGHDDSVKHLRTIPDNQWVISAADETIKVWDLTDGSIIHTLQKHTSPITSLILIPDQHQLISSSEDKTLRRWDLQQGVCLQTLEGHRDRIRAVAVTPDGRLVVSGAEDGEVRIWDLNSDSNKSQFVFNSHNDWWINAVAIDQDGNRIITASDDKTVKIWDVNNTEEPLETLDRHTDAVNAIAITPNWKRLVSVSEDHTLKVWDSLGSQPKYSSECHGGEIKGLTVSCDQRWAVSASVDTNVMVWDLANGKRLHTLKHDNSVTTDDNSVTTVAITHDSRKILSGSRDGVLKIWDLPSGQERAVLTEHTGQINAIALTPDGQLAISASDDRKLVVWNLESGKRLDILAEHELEVNAVTVSSNGKLLVSASDDKTLKVWDLQQHFTYLHTLKGHTSRVRTVKITSNGKLAISGSDDYTLKIWDLASGEMLHTLEGHTDCITALLVDSSNQRVVSASSDKTIKIWDLSSYRCLRTLQGHDKLIHHISFVVNCRYIVSASDDWTVKVWDLNNGEVIATFTGDSKMVTCDATSNDRMIVAGEKSGRVHFLRLEGLGLM